MYYTRAILRLQMELTMACPLLKNMNAVSILPVLLRPLSRGTVLLQSSNPWDPPLIDPKDLTEGEDLDLLVEAVEAAVHMVNTSTRLQEHKFQVPPTVLYTLMAHVRI